MLFVGARGAGQGREAPEGSLEARRRSRTMMQGATVSLGARVKAACLAVTCLFTVKSSALTVPARRDRSACSREESDSDREHIRRQAFARSRFRCEAKDDVVQGPVSDMRRA